MKYYVNTNIGVVRSENQDRAQVFENEHAFVAILCDGMGGHFGGSLASSITIDTFKNRMPFLTNDKNDVFEWFKESIKKAKNNMVIEAGEDTNKKDMGTTVTSIVIFKDNYEMVVFNIGDSRTYLFDGLLHQITIDHNLMNYYIKHEGISEFEASKKPGAAALTSALGPSKKTNIEAFSIESRRGPKTVILTSDGIHDYISKPRFEIIIANEQMSLEEKTYLLIEEGIKGGSTDNLSVVIVEVE